MFDVITIGSNTIDVYIYTKKGMYHLLRRKSHEELSFDLGSKIEIENIKFSTGGSGTNTAVCLKRLGLNVAYLGKLGNDDNKNIILQMLKKEKIPFLGKTDPKHMTGYSVILDAVGHDRTVLTYKGANDFIKKKDVKFSQLKTKWFYLGSLLGDSFKTAKDIIKYAKKNNIKILYNPSLYQAKWGINKLSVLIKNSDILIMNKEEAQLLLKTNENRTEILIRKLKKFTKGIAIITCGPEPLYCFDGKVLYKAVPKKTRIVETTGAGDAFAASFLAGFINTKNIEYALKMALINSHSVITHFGAKEKLLRVNEMNSELKKSKFKIIKIQDKNQK